MLQEINERIHVSFSSKKTWSLNFFKGISKISSASKDLGVPGILTSTHGRSWNFQQIYSLKKDGDWWCHHFGQRPIYFTCQLTFILSIFFFWHQTNWKMMPSINFFYKGTLAVKASSCYTDESQDLNFFL